MENYLFIKQVKENRLIIFYTKLQGNLCYVISRHKKSSLKRAFKENLTSRYCYFNASFKHLIFSDN